MPARTFRNGGSENDPLAIVTQPPADETEEQKEARLRSEREAKRVSDIIDEELERQRSAERRGEKPIKILLLGQSESGKSTTLKNFQLMYQPKAFRRELASWRAVIQLNVVQSFNTIFDTINRVQQLSQSSRENLHDLPQLSPELLKLKLRLTPLLQVRETLIRRLSPVGSGETEATQLNSPSSPTYAARSKNYLKEIAVNSAAQWKDTFNRLVNDRESFDSDNPIDFNDPNDPGVVLNACSEDMIKLWNDPTIQQLLDRQNLRMEELAGFFLDSLDRVTGPRYIPTDDDILRARLKTLGVSEHRFSISSGSTGIGRDWRVFDVGGHRSQRAFWAPYFDDMDAIIFLAPISCFDQVLAEDPKLNRLEDSINIWTTICSNKLLKDTNIILFLNKSDILRAKLASGIKLSDYVVSYGDRPNDFEHASAYLQKKFEALFKMFSPAPRVFYSHLTTVTDTKSTKLILSNLKDMIMRQNLAKTNLIV